MTDGERNGHGRIRRHGEGTARTRTPRGGGQPLRLLHALGFFFHVFFHGNMGKGAAIVTAMTAHAPFFDPAFLDKSLIALGTDKDPFDVMDLPLKLHAFPPSGGRIVRIDSANQACHRGFRLCNRESMRGFAPTRRGSFDRLRTGSFVSAKGPKTIGARAWPQGVPLPQSRSLGLRNSLRSDSPAPHQGRDCGAATPAGAKTWRHGMTRYEGERKATRTGTGTCPYTDRNCRCSLIR